MTAASRLSAFAEEKAAHLLAQVETRIQDAGNPPAEREVHQIRVAIRRFEQARAISSKTQGGVRAKRDLDEIMALAGKVRDCDVALRFAQEYRAAGNTSGSKLSTKDTGNDMGELRAARAAKAQRLAEIIQRREPGTVSTKRGHPRTGRLKSQEMLKKEMREPIQGLLMPMARKFLKRGARACAGGNSTQLHRLRIAAKQFRYSMALFTGCIPLQKWVREVRVFQNVLGELNDCQASRKLLRDHLKERDAPELLKILRARQKGGVKLFRQLWEGKFGKAASARQWLKGLDRAITQV